MPVWKRRRPRCFRCATVRYHCSRFRGALSNNFPERKGLSVQVSATDPIVLAIDRLYQLADVYYQLQGEVARSALAGVANRKPIGNDLRAAIRRLQQQFNELAKNVNGFIVEFIFRGSLPAHDIVQSEFGQTLVERADSGFKLLNDMYISFMTILEDSELQKGAQHSLSLLLAKISLHSPDPAARIDLSRGIRIKAGKLAIICYEALKRPPFMWAVLILFKGSDLVSIKSWELPYSKDPGSSLTSWFSAIVNAIGAGEDPRVLVRYGISEFKGVIGWASTVSASALMDLPLIKGQVQALHSSLIDELQSVTGVEVASGENGQDWAECCNRYP
jgi:hypothetical protein